MTKKDMTRQASEAKSLTKDNVEAVFADLEKHGPTRAEFIATRLGWDKVQVAKCLVLLLNGGRVVSASVGWSVKHARAPNPMPTPPLPVPPSQNVDARRCECGFYQDLKRNELRDGHSERACRKSLDSGPQKPGRSADPEKNTAKETISTAAVPGEIKIDKGIPVSNIGRGTRTTKYPLAGMAVNDSFFTRKLVAITVLKKFAPKKFTARSVTENGIKGFRYWRIE